MALVRRTAATYSVQDITWRGRLSSRLLRTSFDNVAEELIFCFKAKSIMLSAF